MGLFVRFISSIKKITFGMALFAAMSTGVLAETYTLNFKNADIKEVIKFVADATKLTIVIDPKVKGKIQVISSEPVNEQELYDLFLTIMDVHGFAAVKTGDVVRIVRSKSARSLAGPVVGKNPVSFDNEFVTEVIKLENVNAARLIPILRPLVPQQNHMAAYSESNAIIVAAAASNIKRIKKIIANIDRAGVQETQMIKLEHASAEEAVRILEKLQKNINNQKNSSAKAAKMVADKRTNTIIISGDPVIRAKLAALAKKLDSPLESAGNARVVYLRYAKAKELAKVLTKVVANMAKLETSKDKTKRMSSKNAATIEADEATNAIIVTAEADVMRSLDAIIKSLDIPRAQVLVEAIIVEVANNNDKALGIDWLFANEHGGFGSNSVTAGSPLGGVAKSFFETNPVKKLESLAGALAGSQGGTYGAGRYSENGTSLAAIITALETKGEANILSTPSVVTLDNKEATIVVGQEVPFTTGSYSSTGGSSSNPGNPFQTIKRENVGITLKVTPRISEGDNVELELLQESSEVTPGTVGGQPITNERKIETSVVTKDGDIIVLGGLIQDKVTQAESKVPFLGDIPLLGRLFRFNKTDTVKTNLLVFIKPTIIRDSERMEQISSDKYNKIRDLQIKKKGEGIDLFPDEIAPILPAWEKQAQSIEAIRASADKPVDIEG